MSIESMKQNPIAVLYWSLLVHCPKCEHTNDLADDIHDTEHSIAGHLFSNNWDALNGWEVTCESCTHEFIIDKVEY